MLQLHYGGKDEEKEEVQEVIGSPRRIDGNVNKLGN
jgi:hypothetical protein